jgi:CheY-specific phosphatase CheX
MASPLQPAALRSLVSKVMQASCGLSFNPAGDEAISAKPWRTAALPIKGGTPMTVAIGADETACFAMASGLLQMAPNELDPGMVEDSLREILNMVAGHIKRAMAIDLALGLPEIVPHTEMERRMKAGGQRVAVTTGRVNLTVWITNQS